MRVDLDTFLVALYTLVDDLWQTEILPHKPVRPGPAPRLSDSEVLTLLLCGHWLGNSERRLLRYANAYWQPYFPRLLSQSAFNRRGRDLAGVLVQLVPLVARELASQLSPYQVLDGVPLPLARRGRGSRHRLFANEASIGRGGSERGWYYGCKVLLAVSAEGVITGFVVAPAATEERWLADALLCWRTDRWRPPWSPAELPPSHRKGGGYVGPTGPLWPPDGAGVPATRY